ncbi:MAG: hypothetical protein AAFO82_11000, partial [Bacteroidota bacterium]
SQYDYIKGYLEYEDIHPIGTSQMAIKVKLLTSNGKSIHPISKATFQALRLTFPELVYPGYNTNANPSEIFKGLFGFVNELRNIITGFDKAAMQKDWGKKVNVNQSWIRLANPTYKKLGGGSRVKQVSLSDKWDVTPNNDESIYGKEYLYEKETVIDGRIIQISTGVAEYEPLIGGEENLMKQPLPYKQEIKLAPDNFHYTEAPLGESLFPAPSVGYSEVKVRNLQHPNVSRTATGWMVAQFYTAKDFPIITNMTAKKSEKVKANPILKFFKIGVKESLGVSQGFSVELNDMHGKQKAEHTYNEQGYELASTRYEYEVENPVAQQLKLNNEVNTLKPDGSVGSATMGLEVDVWQHMFQDTTSSRAGGVAVNTEGFLVFIIPIVVVPIIPIIHTENKKFFSATTTKLINRRGILKKVIATTNGSKLETENMLYDSETGGVLLTRTENEFDDAMYQLGYPAHWAYEKGMGQAYKNIGGIFDDLNIQNGVLQNYQNLLHSGDELLIETGSGSAHYYLYEKAGVRYVMDAEGTPFNQSGASFEGKVIRSARRNMASASISAIASRQYPISNNTLDVAVNKEILAAGANTYSDAWQIGCFEQTRALALDSKCEEVYRVNDVVAPYTDGVKGNWRPHEAYTYYTGRTQNSLATNVSVREDGKFTSFTPFWQYNGAVWEATPSDPKWTLGSEITIHDDRGHQIETVDAIGVFSAAEYGYNSTQMIGIANNSMAKEMTYDGFEDYDY